MDPSHSCVLCLSTDRKCFLEVLCGKDETPDKSQIITKHLGFDLKVTPSSHVCVQCWKSVYDFHLFYCKVQTIHTEELDELLPRSKLFDVASDDHDYEFGDEIVKVEPLDVPQDEEEDEVPENPAISIHPDSDPERQSMSDRPRRSIKPPDRFKSDPKDLVHYQGKLPSLDDGPCEADDDDLASVCSQLQIDETRSNTDSEPAAVIVVSPKKRRGRPPKQKAVAVEDTATPAPAGATNEPDTVAVPPKKRKGRPTKEKPTVRLAKTAVFSKRKITTRAQKRERSASMSSAESEQDNCSDYEPSITLQQRNFRTKKWLASKLNGPNGKDQKIHAYLEEFVCEYCPEKVQFGRFSEATHHYREQHMMRAFIKCPKCDKKSYSPGEFCSHVETHNDPNRCKCMVCGKMTPSKIALNKHMRCHLVDLEENYAFPCRVCSRRFELEEKRDKHEQLHRPKPVISRQYGRDESMLEFYKRIYCDVCETEVGPQSTSFDNFWDLKVHMTEQHDKAPYLKCPECSKQMGVRHQIMMHIDVHKNPDLYRCEVCNEIHQNLDRHMISAHTPSTAVPEKKRYTCEQCGKIFRYRWKLKYHINEAHGIKDVSCDICKKFFTRPALAAHKRKVHVEGQESFLCDHCPKMFLKQHSLRTHIAFAHENRRKNKKCNLCGKEVSGLSKHMQMVHPADGPTTCDLCGKRFRSSFHMKRHRVNTCAATINSRPYKCEVCGKGFSLKLTMTEHMTTHTRTNLYQCAFCLKTYGYLSNLQKHRKKAHPVEWQQVQGDNSIVTVIPLNAPAPVDVPAPVEAPVPPQPHGTGDYAL